ncbi:MAG: inorganic pyrophosphatase [Chloroflexota bacterium]|nr:inorganic pyrophosphatase [Chloroflexota bacterium]
MEARSVDSFDGGGGRGNVLEQRDRFWALADELVAKSELVIERPRGSAHPRWQTVYPLDYGFLAGTRAMDDGGIDVWRGSLSHSSVTGAIAAVDVLKGDAELKLLVGCTRAEAEEALAMHLRGSQAGMLLWREMGREEGTDT